MLIYGEEADDKAIVKMPRYRADSQFNSKTGSFCPHAEMRLSRKAVCFFAGCCVIAQSFPHQPADNIGCLLPHITYPPPL